MTYITTEYEAEAIAGRRCAILTIRDGQGAMTTIPVTILSFDWGRVKPGAAVAAFACDGPPTAQWAFTDKDTASVDVYALFDALTKEA